MKSICGIDCTNCELSGTCNGCAATEGQPFGAECLVAQCCKKSKTALSELKEKLIAAFNALHIPDMEEVTELNALKGFLLAQLLVVQSFYLPHNFPFIGKL